MAVSQEQRREIGLTEATFQTASDELASLSTAGKSEDAYTADTLEHCREMAEI